MNFCIFNKYKKIAQDYNNQVSCLNKSVYIQNEHNEHNEHYINKQALRANGKIGDSLHEIMMFYLLNY